MDLTCQFEAVEPDIWRCTRCGFVRSSPANRRCGPPRIVQAAHAAAAAGRVGRAIVKREPVRVSLAEQGRRLAICQSCEHFTGRTCALCGCFGAFKAHLATEQCPDPQGDRWALAD